MHFVKGKDLALSYPGSTNAFCNMVKQGNMPAFTTLQYDFKVPHDASLYFGEPYQICKHFSN